MKTSIRFSCALLLLCVGTGGSIAAAQSRQPNPPPGSQLPNLKPLALVNVSLDGVAKPIGSSPTGTIVSTPEFSVPRNGIEKILEIRTRDGRSNVRFTRTLPIGVSQSAIQFIQESVPAPNAVGRLRFSGCATCLVASIIVTLTAEDPSGTKSGQVKLNLTASNGAPSVNSITRSGGTDVRPRYEIKFVKGSFDPADSQVIATYAGNLKYRLIPETTSNFAVGSMFVVVERLKAERNVQVFLRNSYGSSSISSINLPLQAREDNPPFECFNCSTTLGNVTVHDTFSIRHSNSGTLAISGTDQITITPLQTGPAACDQPDFIYKGARVAWVTVDGGPTANVGTVSVSSQPPLNQVLRTPQNRINTTYSLNPFNPDRFYQVVFAGVDVVGVCPNRVVQ